MKAYKLLTPGPLTTSTTVKNEMLHDRCTWDEDYKELTQKLRTRLLELGMCNANAYTTIFMQGSGTFSVEAVLTTAIHPTEKILILVNGAYGERLVTISTYLGLNYEVYSVPYHQVHNCDELEKRLKMDPQITHVAFVHCETTTGILNPLEALAAIVKANGKVLIVDAMSSFGGMEIPIEKLEIDYLISSANKCIQGVPGFGFVIAKKQHLASCKGNSRSLSLDLFAQWEEMDTTGKWRFTSPTHVVAAFDQAMNELEVEGGISAREKRYQLNNEILRTGLEKIGMEAYIQTEYQSPIITTFTFPHENFDFKTFYHYVKERGYVLYPGKLTDALTFRVGNIGEIYPEDMEKLINIIKDYMEEERKI